MSNLRSINLGRYEFRINPDVGYYPYYSMLLRARIRKKLASNTVCTGDGGIGKTYQVTDICRILSPKHFTIDEVVFTYSEFMRLVAFARMGVPITFDEPSYAMGKREWYEDLNKALVKTIESFRFKVHPLFIPIINKNLLDKTIRNYLLQFQIVMYDRGRGFVYRLYPSQFEDKIYRYKICKLKYNLLDWNLCPKDSCLGCKILDPTKAFDRCMIFRAQYERKKASTQEERYKQAIEDADTKESQNLTIDEIEAKAMTEFDYFYNKDKHSLDIEKLKVILRRKFRIPIGHNKSYQLASLIQYDHPQYFDKAEAINENNQEEKKES